MPDFVSMNEFVDRTASAKAEHYVDVLRMGLRNIAAAVAGAVPAVIADEFEAEFKKMKEFLLDRYNGVRSDHTFRDANGNFIDCIPFEQQQTVRAAVKAGRQATDKAPAPPDLAAVAKPDPMKQPPEPFQIVPTMRRGLTDAFGNLVACPEGRVPVRRVTLSQLAIHGRFDYFFHKNPGRSFMPLGAKAKRRKTATKAPAKRRTARKAVAPLFGTGPTEAHRHAICQDTQGGPYYGCSHGLNIWASDPSPGVFDLSQLWMIGFLQGGVQTIESGWTVYPTLPGFNLGYDPGLFVYFNPDNYGARSGYLVNQYGEGFIQVPGSAWTLFSGYPKHSTRGGDQVGLVMLWQLKDDGNWWLYIGQDADSFEAVGYIPAYLYQAGPLAQAADQIQFGGEVASVKGSTATGPMGSGVAPYQNPDDNWGEVAFQYAMYVQKAQGQPMVAASLEVADVSGEPYYSPNYQGALYDEEKWRSYFFFGGPSTP